jgi:hypothetical protein
MTHTVSGDLQLQILLAQFRSKKYSYNDACILTNLRHELSKEHLHLVSTVYEVT